MHANQRKTKEIVQTDLNYILTDLVQKEVEKISKIINDKLKNNNNQQRQTYASTDSIDIINDLIEICENYTSFRKISHALDIISKDSILRNILQMVICHGNLEMPDQTIQSKESSNTNMFNTSKKIYSNSSDSSYNDVILETKPKTKTI
ncbi:unnamed protein product [Rotaria sp. Silwood1]|nr:unnamed protein product [Rotaria sp. Silwood1]CAF1638896.1 unnamed protein product [Rotaria sp. Silwood1]CAF3765439.1 unnamed protein product [Rotaria sp. Silwood1]CAF3807626.1 unnamed protein product [Rotaria sp. Silwood1]CAF3892024.1 unnamed protein product [Rotaria sp. Silwood1]